MVGVALNLEGEIHLKWSSWIHRQALQENSQGPLARLL